MAFGNEHDKAGKVDQLPPVPLSPPELYADAMEIDTQETVPDCAVLSTCY